MKFDFMIMIKKGFMGFFTGLAAVVIFAIVDAITGYKPVICTEQIIDNCVHPAVAKLWLLVIPVITGGLVSLGNWLKNRKNV